MITDAILGKIADVLTWLAGLLPLGGLNLPPYQDISTLIGTYTGPFDKILPMSEAMTFAYIFFAVWLPTSIAYTIAMFVFTHMPFIGKGS